ARGAAQRGAVHTRGVPVSTAASRGHSLWVTSQRLEQGLLRHRPFPPGDLLKPQSRDSAPPTPSEGLGSELRGVPVGVDDYSSESDVIIIPSALDFVSQDEMLTPLGRLDKYAASENIFNRYAFYMSA
uniref:Uncharacterized protein n=1 Tax=Cairina moschata TaxID=8855 RepID=A0A8C3CT92_CAIMO